MSRISFRAASIVRGITRALTQLYILNISWQYYNLEKINLPSEGVCRFSVSAPRSLVEEFDSVIKKIGYDRSKAIQAAMRIFLNDYKWTHDVGGNIAGGLVMIYDHEIQGLEEDLTDVQHRYQNIISSTTHVHLDERHCLEIIPLKGEAKLAKKLSEEIMTKRGVKQSRLVAITQST